MIYRMFVVLIMLMSIANVIVIFLTLPKHNMHTSYEQSLLLSVV